MPLLYIDFSKGPWCRGQQPAPPIWITNNPQLIEGISEKLVDRMQRRVARLADGWMTALATPDEFAGQWRRIVAHAKDLGRDPTQIMPPTR